MANLVFIHGAWANENSWFDLPGLLAPAHNCKPITLPGHLVLKTLDELSLSPASGSGVTMADYVDAIEQAVEDVLPGDGSKCTLIAHSMGGMPASFAAAKPASQIERIIYVAAMLPEQGQSAQDIIDVAGSSPKDLFEAFAVAGPLSMLRALSNQPDGPLSAAFDTTPEFEAVEKHYIRCDDDSVLPPGLQDDMIAAGQPINVVNLKTGHLPQVTMPDILAKEIDAIL